MTVPRVRMAGIVRRFGPVTALDGAELELREGEVHGVLGENGAGKTTLLGILGGMLEPDEGRVEIDGAAVALRTPREAWRHGIGMVHQHFKLVPALTVLENLSLGMRAARGGLGLPYRLVRSRVAELSARTGLDVDMGRPVSELSVGARQRVEILKALLRDPRILVLDEPTAVLTPDEAEALFGLLRDLAADGRAVALVAHKLDEVMAVSDRVTVLRSGRTVYSGVRGEMGADELVRAMVGDDGASAVRGGRDRRGAGRRDGLAGGGGGTEVVAALVGAGLWGARGAEGELVAWAVRDASLEVRRGEIVGVAGVEGNGQRELALLLSGRRAPDAGQVQLPAGTGFVPQDRTTEGLVGDFDLVENVALALHDGDGGETGAGRVLMPWAEARERAEDIRVRYGVRAPDVRVRASALSGGNQQRLVVGRELGIAKDLLVAENPTRGLDVAATAFVREELSRRVAAPSGDVPGVVLISSDLDEVLALADRVFVMVRGRLVPVPETRLSREGIGAMMLGANV